MAGADNGRATVAVCFCRDFAAPARRLAAELEAANVTVVLDQWVGPAGSERRSAHVDLDEVGGIVVVFTPSEITRSWIGEPWRGAVYEPAVARDIPVFGVRAQECAIPEFLGHLDFADLHRRGYQNQLRRLLSAIERFVDGASVTPSADSGPDEGFDTVDIGTAQSVEVRIGAAHGELADPELASDRTETAAMMQDGLFYELGVTFPLWTISVDDRRPDEQMSFVLNGVTELEVTVPQGRSMVNDSAEEVNRRGFDALRGTNPANRNPTAWVSTDDAHTIRSRGLTVWDPTAFVVLTLSALLRNKAADFVGVREARRMLAILREPFPLLVEESVPGSVTEFEFTEVLRRLVAEYVSIRNLRRILLALMEWGRVERDPLMLTEYVRAGLRDQITHTATRGQGVLVVFLLDPEVEAEIRSAITFTPTGSYVDLPPERIASIERAVRGAIDALGEGVQLPVILTVMEVRSAVQRLIRGTAPHVRVLSYQELSPNVRIQPVGRIIPGAELTLRDFDVVSPWSHDA